MLCGPKPGFLSVVRGSPASVTRVAGAEDVCIDGEKALSRARSRPTETKSLVLNLWSSKPLPLDYLQRYKGLRAFKH